ncbi:MAG: cardiolipin synthase [Tissierellia bacterium]|nr:cardiolipin synthase [Tissierellia bacterium]
MAKKKYRPYKRRLKFWPVFTIALLFLIQIGVFALIFYKYIGYLQISLTGWILVLAIFSIYMVNKDEDPDIKMSWIILEALFPIFGILLYGFFNLLPGKKKAKESLEARKAISSQYIFQDEEVFKRLGEKNRAQASLSKYLQGWGFPVYQNTDLRYFHQGEDFFESVFEDLEKAQHFIAIEFFVISPGLILDRFYEIFSRKIEEGVKILFLYDGTNNLFLPKKVMDRFERIGVDCRQFLPINAVLTSVHNNRDHRKIIVIDNQVAYTGGVNLADEYANLYNKIGHWVDTGVRLEGEAVSSLTALFFEMWDFREEDDQLGAHLLPLKEEKPGEAFVIPFGEHPHMRDSIGENVYLEIINRSIDYVYITSPYLTITDKMSSALKLAAQRGVDVTLVFPHIGDHKKIPLAVARTYYEELAPYGVKIFEYAPGFVHSKTLVSDDEVAVVGTINMDYRSFYLHYEDGVLVFCPDFALTLRGHIEKLIDQSIYMTQEEYKKTPLHLRVKGRVLRLMAPLM